MKIIPVASESMGTRSMATLVEVGEERIFIDPGVALGPWRYGLRPHPIEEERREIHTRKILEELKTCKYVIITHFHRDHYLYRHPEAFVGKKLLVKDPENNINHSQQFRAGKFLPVKEFTPADGKSFQFENFSIHFSPPFLHGEGPAVIISVLIEEKKRFLFTSDVCGPVSEDQLRFILDASPHILYLDGPPTYLDFKPIERVKENMMKILEIKELEAIIIDHHLTRDIEWREKIREFLEEGERRGIKILTAAAFAGEKEEFLEAWRKRLYGK